MLRLPEAAGGVLEDGGPLGVARLGVLVGLVLPARVRDDDLVGHGLQAVVDDHHLQGLVGRQVPQGSCRGRARVTIKAEEEEEVLGWGGWRGEEGEEGEEAQEEDYEENIRGNKKGEG